VRVSFIYPFWSVIVLHPSSYEGYAAHSAALEGFAVAYAVLRHVAACPLCIALVGGWHSRAIAYSHRSQWVEHRAAHLPCSRSLRRSANVFPSSPRSGHALSDETRYLRPSGAACCGILIIL
jgi:hypothetical protein